MLSGYGRSVFLHTSHHIFSHQSHFLTGCIPGSFWHFSHWYLSRFLTVWYWLLRASFAVGSVPAYVLQRDFSDTVPVHAALSGLYSGYNSAEVIRAGAVLQSILHPLHLSFVLVRLSYVPDSLQSHEDHRIPWCYTMVSSKNRCFPSQRSHIHFFAAILPVPSVPGWSHRIPGVLSCVYGSDRQQSVFCVHQYHNKCRKFYPYQYLRILFTARYSVFCQFTVRPFARNGWTDGGANESTGNQFSSRATGPSR